MTEKKYNIGLVSVSFRDRSPEEILKAMAAAGLTHIEWGSDVHAPFDNVENLHKLHDLCEEYGIVCSSYGTYFRFGKTPLSELEGYISAAKILGTDILRLWCGSKSRENMSEDEVQEFISECKTAAEIAERHGVTLCMECHRKTFTEKCEDAVYLMNEVNSKNFRMYWQPFQWQTAEENVINAGMIAPYSEHIHVFNWKGEAKLPLGDAVGEWQEYLEAFSTPRTLLLEFMPNGTLDELETETLALKKIIGNN